MATVIEWSVVPVCLLAAWVVLRRPVRHLTEDLRVDHARATFRQEREWLEARFLSALARVDPIELVRWEDARWQDEVLWARDRQTRVLLALIGVRFDGHAYDELGEPQPRHATALFEYRRGRWRPEGKRLDEVRPDEAVLRNRRFEPVVVPARRLV
jgi:hypothetical protein